MTAAKLERILGWFLGIGFILFGLIETGVAINARSSIGFFWFPALCGGGALILLGMFKIRQPVPLSAALVVIGCLLGALATMWTVLIPVLAVTLIVLVLRNPREAGVEA